MRCESCPINTTYDISWKKCVKNVTCPEGFFYNPNI